MSNPPPPVPASGIWRLFASVIIGFGLPVLACYGLVLTAAIALRLVTPSGPPGLPRVTGTGPAVAIIHVEGIILSKEPDTVFETSAIASAATLVEQFEQANEDSGVRAIVLIVDSPGGGVNASDVIYNALQQVDKPVVVLMGDLAASGGYYISMAADWIVAHPNTLTGSIGVISEFPNAEEFLDKVGVEFVVVTSGPRKDFGSPYRDMTAEERAYWQSIVDETYASFVAVVAEGRGMTPEEVVPLADGRVFTGRQALDLGLVDALGYEADAIAKAAELGGITGEPRIIEYEAEPGLFDVFSGAVQRSSLAVSIAEAANLLGHPRLQARWVGP